MNKPDKRKMIPKGTLFRTLKSVFKFFPRLLPITVVCIIFSAAVSAIPPLFMQNIIAIIEENVTTGNWAGVSKTVLSYVFLLAVFYVLSLASGALYNQLMAFITQGTLKKFRERMFDRMQDLPISYFDKNNHGDIMSYYTNDIDTLRQMISQSMPQLLISGVTVLTLFVIMIYFSLWLAAVVLLGVGPLLYASAGNDG